MRSPEAQMLPACAWPPAESPSCVRSPWERRATLSPLLPLSSPSSVLKTDGSLMEQTEESWPDTTLPSFVQGLERAPSVILEQQAAERIALRMPGRHKPAAAVTSPRRQTPRSGGSSARSCRRQPR